MFLEHSRSRRYRWIRYGFITLGALLSLFVLIGGSMWYVATRTSGLGHFVTNTAVQQLVQRKTGVSDDLMAIAVDMLGFTRPHTYLFLLQNNTELRPGGGFIGVYAVVTFTQGHPRVEIIEGTELLDRRTPSSWKPVPPQPISEYLGVDRWYFRDSNWSPDFVESARTALQFYQEEGGLAADRIDTVIGITPTVLEEILKHIGPVTVQGITFAPENVIEKLEYEVEYAYKDRGIATRERKQIMNEFMDVVIDHLASAVLRSPQTYVSLFGTLANQKHIVLTSADSKLQGVFDAHHWTGRVSTTTNDFLMWVDANLGALKTDHALQREVSYRIRTSTDGSYIGTVAMTYRHTGRFDWRTTRYLTYARLFVPQGSLLHSVDGKKRNGSAITLPDVDQGEEFGKTWFGTFFSIEPGQTKTLTFSYRLPETIRSQIAAHTYMLLVQKQLGTIATGLTLELNFGTTISGAVPAEEKKNWGDAVYQYETTLREDVPVTVRF